METARAMTAALDTSLAHIRQWQLVVGSSVATLSLLWIWQQLHGDEDVYCRARKFFFRVVRKIPSIKRKIDQKSRETYDSMCAKLDAECSGLDYVKVLPQESLDAADVLREIDRYTSLSRYKHQQGHLSGTVYHGGAELTDLMTSVYQRAAWSNPLHPSVFPGVRKMEAEIVSMCCEMFHGQADACGSVTSGGTESIMLAMKACRELARAERSVSRPEILVPVSAHAAFDKGAQLMGIRLRHVVLDPVTSRVNVATMKRLISTNTIMLACSAPAFPHGSIDPIAEVAALGVRYGIPVHVDACLGGFLLAFMNDAGYPTVEFDFRVAGVTSISADTHKYGYTPKGTSVVLYNSRRLHRYQYFVQPNWPGGIYASPSLAGSRSGAVIAGCWAAMRYFGRDGYVQATRKVIDTARFLEKQFHEIDGLQLMGSCDVSVVAVTSSQFNIYHLLDRLDARGWNWNALQYPAGIHIAVTYCHTAEGVRERLLEDVRHIVAQLMLDTAQQTPDGDKCDASAHSDTAALYGMTTSLPDRSLVTDLAHCFLDSLYHVGK